MSENTTNSGDDGIWFDVGDLMAREKVSQAFRDALHGNYRSSNEFKKKKRRLEKSADDERDKKSNNETISKDDENDSKSISVSNSVPAEEDEIAEVTKEKKEDVKENPKCNNSNGDTE